MGMHFVQYGDENTEKVESVYHQDTLEDTVNFERTEDLPEQRDDAEIKKTFKESGGIASVTNASLLQSEEVTVMNTEGGKRLSMKNEDSVVGLYSVDEDGNNKMIITEDGDMPRVEEIATLLNAYIAQTNATIESMQEEINNNKEDIEDLQDAVDDLTP